MAEMGEKTILIAGLASNAAHVGVDQGLACRRLRQRDLDHLYAAPSSKGFHAGLHAVVIEIGVEHRIAGLQAIVLKDQRLHRLGRVASEADLVDPDAHRIGKLRASGFDVADHGPARIIARVAIHPLDMRLIGREHRPRHHSPIAVLELDDLAGHVIFARDPVPVVGGCRSGDGGRPRREGRRRRASFCDRSECHLHSSRRRYQTDRSCRLSGPAVAQIIRAAALAAGLGAVAGLDPAAAKVRGNPLAPRPAIRIGAQWRCMTISDQLR